MVAQQEQQGVPLAVAERALYAVGGLAVGGARSVGPGVSQACHLVTCRASTGPFGIVTKTIGRHLILHDLRRTFRSIAEAIGVTEYQRMWLINHSTKNDVDLSYVGLSDAAMAAAAKRSARFRRNELPVNNR